MKRALAVLLLSLPVLCLAKTERYPQCERFPIYRAYGDLKEVGLLVQDLDYANARSVLLAAEKVRTEYDGEQIWRLVYHITFHEKGGKDAKVITVNESSELECTISPVEVFIVTGHFPRSSIGRLVQDND